jgi:hypothetical protein
LPATIAPSTIISAPPNIGIPCRSTSGTETGIRLFSSDAWVAPSSEKLLSPVL